MNNFSVIGRLADFVRRYGLLRRAIILGWHILGTCVSYYLAYYLRFEGQIPPVSTDMMMRTLPLLLAVNIITFSLFRIHSGMWSFFSLADLTRMFAALGTAILLFMAGVFSMLHFSFYGFHRSVFVVYALLMIAWMASARLLLRIVRERRSIRPKCDAQKICHVLVVGLLDRKSVV